MTKGVKWEHDGLGLAERQMMDDLTNWPVTGGRAL